MKHLFVLALACAMLTACDKIKPISEVDNSSSMDTMQYAYKARYTHNFEIGNPKYAQIVLNVAKAYETNTMASVRDAFADTVLVDFYDGSSFRGPKDSLIKTITDARSQFASVTTIYGLWVSLQPKGKDEAWVFTWCRETDVMKDSTKQATFFDENWQFNAEGKISYMVQNARKPHPADANR